MNENINLRINNSLFALYNTDDPIYRALISDKYGSIPATITKPTDIDIGCVAAMLEYFRLLALSLQRQMYLDTSSGEFLNFFLNDFFQILRLSGESDASWITRAQGIVFSQKVSWASLIKIFRPFSTVEPEIIKGEEMAMFADVSFADIYSKSTQTLNGSPFHIFPSVTQDFETLWFFIYIILVNTPTADILTVLDLIENSIAAGIEFVLKVNEA